VPVMGRLVLGLKPSSAGAAARNLRRDKALA